MKQFFTDLLKESRDGKFSTKKIWGHICLLLISVTYVMDGWNFYSINTHLFDSLLIAGTTLVGMGTIVEVFKRKTPPKNEDQ